VKRIVFATFGSLGDLHPYLAIALELRRRGHRPLIVTTDVHRATVESEDIAFAPMRPNVEDMGDPAELVRKLFHPTQGPQYLIRDLVMPHVRAAYEDLDRACAGADMLVTHPLTFAGRLVAEKRRLPWRSTVLSPLSLMSGIDPPLFGLAPWLMWVRRLGVAPYRAVFSMIKRSIGSWEKPLHELRADLGLPAMRSYAQFEGQYAPSGNLALFSRTLATPQADWPPDTTVCGFSRYDGKPVDPDLKLELDDWVSAGPAPVVFTLGSSVSMYATDFFCMAIDAARQIGRRALLITGQDPAQYDAPIAAAGLVPGPIKVFRYLPYSAVFPHAAVTVHQGGIGTLAQALAAGKPQLIVPVGFDQPDNARRAVRLGIARSIPFQKLAAGAMATSLRDLLASPAPAAKALTIARTVSTEEQEQHAAALLAT
jgi:UDP:flavonoid glycosyltransferase YjiC (YdhE family)